MLQLRDIMTADVVSVSPELAVRDAIALLGQRHLSGAPVVAGGKVVGVVSATDLLEFAASAPGVPAEGEEPREWDEWGEIPGWEAGDEPPARYFTELWADAGADVSERFAKSATPEWDVLAEHTVGELMTRKVCALPPTADVSAAADYMRTANVHRVLVVDGGRLVGIVSASDITRAVADHRIVERRYVFDTSSRERDREAEY
jgi:CBS domain-containing protein